ncbi:MAG: hypothetical protein H6Q55_1243 [Deltaproteobacteria bacterium]|nr:hypothetical protein [Deltaproteobacteria bacterium]
MGGGEEDECLTKGRFELRVTSYGLEAQGHGAWVLEQGHGSWSRVLGSGAWVLEDQKLRQGRVIDSRSLLTFSFTVHCPPITAHRSPFTVVAHDSLS